MIGNLINANRILLSKAFFQSERWLSCQLCNTTNIYLQKKSLHCKSTGNQVILPSLLHSAPRRKYSIGEYDKLWQSVTSGRGKLAGSRRPKDIASAPVKFNKAGKAWPGFNAEISGIKPKDKDITESTPPLSRNQLLRENPILRGWAGISWPGRHAGPPYSSNGEIIKGFDSIVIEVKRTSVTKGSGRVKQVRAIVVVGNNNGAVGWAIGKGPSPTAAVKKARNRAVKYLHYFPICDGHTIYHNLRARVRNTQIIFERKVPGYGRRCQRIIRAIAELAGIKDLRCKVVGRTTPLTVVECAFQGFQMQETHQELAERTGKNVVELRPEKGNCPVVVAYPSQQAIKRRMEEEKFGKEEDITAAFDPYYGAHRPKSVEEIKGTHPDLLAEMQGL